MKSPIYSARRRSSSFEDLAHLVAAALRLEDELDTCDYDDGATKNENQLQTSNNYGDQDQSTDTSRNAVNAVPSVAGLLASHGPKEDAAPDMPFPSRRRMRGIGSAPTTERRRSSPTRKRRSSTSLEDESITETLADKALVPLSDSKASQSKISPDPHFRPSGSNAAKKVKAIAHWRNLDANIGKAFNDQTTHLASFDSSRFVDKGGLLVLKEESLRSFSNASA